MLLAPVLNQHMQERLAHVTSNNALSALHQASREQLAAKPLPEKFSETWKYTKLYPLEEGHLQRYSQQATVAASLVDFGGETIIVVNGYLPQTLPQMDGVTITRLSTKTPRLADTTFALFNGATVSEGLHIDVPANSQVKPLLHIVFYSTGEDKAHHNTRLFVSMGSNSRIQIIEHYMGDGNQLCNAVSEYDIGENSELVHCRLQSEAAQSLHIGQLAVRQQRNSRVSSYQFMSASRLKRNDVHVMIEGEGAELHMAGAFIARGKGHVDNQVCVEHRVPHCTSNQSYKGIAGDEGQIIFNGRIHILPNASQTLADLSNRNLLLNIGAEINSKPELEIYNDDVKCSHGTTIGQLDPEMRFYLQSRGISEKDALRMLSVGFVQEEIASVPFVAVANWLDQWLGDIVAEGL